MSEDACYRHLFSGLDIPTPLLDGSMRPYINLDNAASTPAFKAVERAVVDFLGYYSSVHRGTGFKSQLSTHAYEDARRRVIAFMGADPGEHTCIFGKNTTEMINRLAKRVTLTGERDMVVVSTMEHHSNDLPWRGVGKVLHIAVTADGPVGPGRLRAHLEGVRQADRAGRGDRRQQCDRHDQPDPHAGGAGACGWGADSRSTARNWRRTAG